MGENEQSERLERLRKFGDPRKTWKWNEGRPDYVKELGLTLEDVPTLVEMAREWLEDEDWPEDDSDLSLYGPIHAWRALAHLRAPETTGLLLEMLDPMDKRGDDWFLEEFADAWALIGPSALPSLRQYLHEECHEEFALICAGHGVCEIARKHPKVRIEAIGVLIELLAGYDENLPSLNAFLISYLLDLKAVEHAELIERAYASGNVDETVCGWWGKVRSELGVEGLGLAPDEPPRPKLSPSSWPFGTSSSELPGSNLDRQQRTALRKKRKRERQARKRSRY
jgi:hypothetical protein